MAQVDVKPNYLETYKKICLIGEGSFGRVYQAVEVKSQKTVAIKIISKTGRSYKELTSLKRECDIQKHLKHPNIVKFIESYEFPHEFIIITDFAHMSLSQLLEKQKRLNENICIKIICNLVSALYYLHSNRVLHRDLKPQNVLLNKDGVAMLCDFGFARSMGAGTYVLTSIKGTPLYMAPELIEEKPYDHTADLWSLGCIAYEIHIGHPPFKTMSILQLIKLLKTQDIKLPTTTSDNYRSFIQGLLEKDASKRLSWPHLLEHPFIRGQVEIQEDSVNTNINYDLYEKRGSRKSITTIVEVENDESEEWVCFLKSCLSDLMSDTELESKEMFEQSFILMLITSLRNQSCQVFELITNILVILLTKKQYLCEHNLSQVYLDTRVVSNVLLAIKNLVGNPAELKENTDDSGVEMLQRVFMFLNYLVYTDALNSSGSSSLGFLHQLCDTIAIFKMETHFSCLLRLDLEIISHILSILILIVTRIPDNCNIVENILKHGNTFYDLAQVTDPDIQEKVKVLTSLLPSLQNCLDREFQHFNDAFPFKL